MARVGEGMAGLVREGLTFKIRSGGRGDSGFSLVEVLAATLVVGIAVVGVALMFGKGAAWVSATGDDRVAAGLAQQRIEQIRAGGWGVATAVGAIGTLITDPTISAGNNLGFTRTVCIQYVDPTSPVGLTTPGYTPAACPAGTETTTIRMTVVVTSNRPEASPVILQAWMTSAGP
jgi:prepilin-type N-terminal cleavage/methylation domain-containing protein